MLEKLDLECTCRVKHTAHSSLESTYLHRYKIETTILEMEEQGPQAKTP